MAYPGLSKEEVKINNPIPIETNIVIEYNLGKLNEQTFTPTNTPTETPTATPTEVPYVAPAYQASYGNSNAQSSYYSCQCVWYVAGRRTDLPNLGNARDWLSNAQRFGFKTGYAPAAGAVVSLNESYWGHVAYVESVNGGFIRVSEMNVEGCWVSYRNISIDNGVILGYIY